ncbi:hypothetical protein ATG_17670 [Desulfurococcaceae archaeon AG1]|nr:hypothetical protein ATG_17670 [Desulfurococcaceae archaeon AG1]
MGSNSPILRILDRILWNKLIITSSQAIYFSPFIKTSLHSRGRSANGILLGRVINSGRNIFWNPNISMSPHVVVVGPTGSGKTETLLSIATKMNSLYSVTVLMIDVKGDIKSRLERRGYFFNLIDVPRDPLGSLYPYYIDPVGRAGQVFESIVSSYEVHDIRAQASLYKAIKKAYEITPLPTWQHVMAGLIDGENPENVMISRVVDEIAFLDGGPHNIGHYSVREGVINVISLAGISKEREEMLSYAMNMVFHDMLNYMSSRSIDPKTVRGVLVIDEAWVLSKHGKSSNRVLNLIKLSRGYGLSVLLATQSFRDFGDSWDRILENTGVLIVLNTPSKRFWFDASNFLKISREAIEDLMIILGKGDAIIRVLPDPRPIPISLENDVEEPREGEKTISRDL